MNNPGFLESIRAAIVGVIELLWMAFAFGLDLLRDISPIQSTFAVAGIVGMCVMIAFAMQRRLNKDLLKHPDQEAPIWRLELIYSAPGIFIYIVSLPALLLGALGGAVAGGFNKSEKEGDKDLSEEQKKAAQKKKEEEEKPLVVATLGPSFLWGGFATASIYLFAYVTEPLVRLHIGAPMHYPGWQYLFFGHRRELAWYIPLDSFPYMAALLATIFWFLVWWWAARMTRLVFGSDLGRNLVKDRDTQEVLSSWREWFGAPWLIGPDDSYLTWAKWLPIAAIPLLLISWASIAGDPYRIDASMFAVTLVLWVSWGLHIYMQGFERLGEEEREIEEKEAVQAPGWRNVMQDMYERFQASEPLLARGPRRVEDLPFTRHEVRDSGLLSPLLTELLPEPGRLTSMQHALLTTISLQAYVHTDPPLVQREFSLDPGARQPDQVANMRHRNQIVVAPEGAGKTTLALLAACNHALVHTQSTLIVARDDERADALFEHIRQTLSPSTLRWNIRVRKVGGDLVNDLSQGIIPDIIVCSLRQLVVNFLDNASIYRPFLENLGLIIADDIEAFCGPVEIHAQLAFRRLGLRVRELLNIKELGEEQAPIMLVLGTEAMQDMSSWIRSLCGIDAVTRHFALRNEEVEEREAAQLARLGIGPDAPTGEEAAEETFQGRYHRFYRLNDFKTASGERLGVMEIIAACERLAVPWHYRPCGDERRHLGRRLLVMRDEPEYNVDDPADACVVFLEGNFSAVEREISRLSRAGSNFSSLVIPEGESAASKEARKDRHPEAIAIITIVDGDEEMAFTEYNTRSPLAESIAQLPRPIVRAPSGRIVNSHIASDLVNHWIELEDFLDVFGHGAADTAYELSKSSMLLTEPRIDVHDEVQDYEKKLYVRALATATATDRNNTGEARQGKRVELPPKVSQVELASSRACAVRDRTNLNAIAEVDAGCASLLYYPGRIFGTAQGRFIVAGSVGEGEADNHGDMREGDILVEPFMGDELSSPRRRSRVQVTTGRRGEAFFLPEPLLMGNYPIQVGLSAVRIRTEHVATYRLGPDGGEVRQRILRSRREVQETSDRALATDALAIYPNPESTHESAPLLTVEDARLVTAAMRAVLATMYRGAATSLDVALHIEEEFPAPDAPLTSTEGIFVYDLHAGGNGAARAIHRDGVELLLRLVRMYLERVLYHERLVAQFDHWGTESEVIHSHVPLDAAHEGDDELGMDLARTRRRRVLTWLDSRLRPEGRGLAGISLGQMASGQEGGEGDLLDIGRAWYSPDGLVTDLVWARHRWQLDERREAAVDVGFDRLILSTASSMRYTHDPLLSLVKEVTDQGKNGALCLEDGSFWGMPRTVWTLMPGQVIPVGSHAEHVNAEHSVKLLANACAMAVSHWTTIGPLAELFMREYPPAELMSALASFVQGIPNAAVPMALEPRSPVHTLLYRLGSSDAQSLLLAMLLRRCGIDAGLFFCPAEKRVLAAAAIDPAEGIAEWAKNNAVKEAGIVFWSESPSRPGSEKTGSQENTVSHFVPIDPMQHRAIGRVITNTPDGWVFLPLGHAWDRIGDRLGNDDDEDKQGDEEAR